MRMTKRMTVNTLVVTSRVEQPGLCTAFWGAGLIADNSAHRLRPPWGGLHTSMRSQHSTGSLEVVSDLEN